MQILFIIIWAVITLSLQMFFRFSFFGFQLGFDFLTLLIIYVCQNYPLGGGVVSILSLGYILEAFSPVPHGFLAMGYLILFFIMQLLRDHIYAEAYVTKAVWVIPQSFFIQYFNGVVLIPMDAPVSFLLWLACLTQALLDAGLGIFFFMVLDVTFDRWIVSFSRKKASLTGADFFQLKSNQRKYFDR